MKILTYLLLIIVLTANASTKERKNFYQMNKIPSVDKKWSGADYMATARVFAANPSQLPTSDNPLFKKITDWKRFDYYRNKSLPIEKRVEDFKMFNESTQIVLGLFMKEANRGKENGEEVAEMIRYLLNVQSLGLDLIDEYKSEQIKKNNFSSERSRGVELVYRGTMLSFFATEEILGKRNFFTPQEISSITKEMSDVLPQFLKTFSEENQLKMKKLLEKRKSEFKKQEDIEQLDKMITLLSS